MSEVKVDGCLGCLFVLMLLCGVAILAGGAVLIWKVVLEW